MELVPLCLIYQSPLNESNLSLLAPVLTKLAHLSMPFILVMFCTAHSARINNILKQYNLQENSVCKLK